MLQSGFRAALVQSLVGKDRLKNLEHVSKLIAQATGNGAQLVALPECFNSPYGTKFFDEYAETIPDGPTSKMLSESAKKHSVYIIGGTFPERDGNKLFNTCTVWNPCGDMVAKFRKMHLFDIDIPGQITFKESEILSAGNELVTFDMNGVCVGLGICYDLRFEEMAKLYRKKGCKLLIYPGAFNMTTGPLHWELLQRARATDNQVFVFAISPARGDKGYIAWGHSQATDPWGKIIVQAKEHEEIVFADLDFQQCENVRTQIPIFHQRSRMPLNSRDILQVCEILAEQEQLKVTVTEVLKGAGLTFGGALLGGLLGGPIGLGIGSAAAGLFAAVKGQGKYKSVVEVIMYDMSQHQKQKLANSVKAIIGRFDASDVLTILACINSDRAIRNLVLDVIKNTVTNELGLTLV